MSNFPIKSRTLRVLHAPGAQGTVADLYRSGFESQGIVGVYVDADGRPVPRGQPAPDKTPFVRFTTEVVTA